MNADVIERLNDVLIARKQADPADSYVAGLYARGLDAILKKLGEESSETIIAAKNGGSEQIIHETADLWFHSLVLLAALDIDPQLVLAELDQRFGRSGLEEKASRGDDRN